MSEPDGHILVVQLNQHMDHKTKIFINKFDLIIKKKPNKNIYISQTCL